MAYWWVSHGQTYRQEQAGGYLWAPLRDKRGGRPHHWATMAEVEPGDIVFCYVDGRINAVAIASSPAYESPKPSEFAGDVAAQWETEGLRVDIAVEALDPPFVVAEALSHLAPLLPAKHGPLNRQGTGNQGYLFSLPPEAGEAIEDALSRPRAASLSALPTLRFNQDLDSVWKRQVRRPDGSREGNGAAGSARRSRESKAIGDRAEELVKEFLESERSGLSPQARASVRWVAREGKQPGWDIQYEEDGRLVAVEVKGTTNAAFPNVEVTAREWDAASRLRAKYRLALVSALNEAPRLTFVDDPFGRLLSGDIGAEVALWRLSLR